MRLSYDACPTRKRKIFRGAYSSAHCALECQDESRWSVEVILNFRTELQSRLHVSRFCVLDLTAEFKNTAWNLILGSRVDYRVQIWGNQIW